MKLRQWLWPLHCADSVLQCGEKSGEGAAGDRRTQKEWLILVFETGKRLFENVLIGFAQQDEKL